MPVPHLYRDIVVIGASAGGVPVLQRLVGGLPEDFPAAVFIVLHVWPGSVSLLPQILARATHLPVRAAQHGLKFERGNIYAAPADFHLFVDQEHMSVLRGPRENRTRPAINPLFRSAARAHGPRVIGIILTGTLDDGAAGLWAVKQCGGLAIVQADAEFPEMPATACEGVAVDHHVPLIEIPPLLDRLTREPIEPSTPAAPVVVQFDDESTKMTSSPQIKLDDVGHRSVFSCPECNGALWELQEGTLQYRCHVGHAYSAATLHAAQDATIEQALWTALRALKESATLDDRLATQSADHNLAEAARVYRASAHDKLVQADHLQQFLASLNSVDIETFRPTNAPAEHNRPAAG